MAILCAAILWGESWHFTCGYAHKQGGPNPLKEYAMRYARIKDVFVRAYRRFRLGKWEDVCQHFRSHPGQMELFPA